MATLKKGEKVQVYVNSNYAGTERKVVDGVIVSVGQTSALVRIRDEVMEQFRVYLREAEREERGAGPDDTPADDEPLYRTIKRKLSRDFPSLATGADATTREPEALEPGDGRVGAQPGPSPTPA